MRTLHDIFFCAQLENRTESGYHQVVDHPGIIQACHKESVYSLGNIL
jgi:hypothetical protein